MNKATDQLLSESKIVMTGQDQDPVAYEVRETKDYSKFKLIGGNRRINLLHVRRLVESFKLNHLVSPIIINEKFEIIDGQHRLKASLETRSPVYYIVVPGYYIEEVQIYNVNQKNWTKMDYLKLYCDKGMPEYLKCREFMDKFPSFGIQPTERLLTFRGSNNFRMIQINGEKAGARDFEEGRLSIPDLKKSYTYAYRVLDFRSHYKNFNRGTFISALLAIFSNKNYRHGEMIKKLNSCPIDITDQPNISTYKLLLEDIFNWHRREDNKVSLRFENE